MQYASESDEAPKRAMRVARALQHKGADEFAKPGHLVEIRFVRGQSLSLTASRLLALMILVAGGDAWKPVVHRMRKADIRRGHKGNERISDMLEELHGTLFAEDDISWRGKKATRRFSLIASSREEVEDTEPGKEVGWIEWEFTPDARRLIQESETYAVMNRTAVLGFRSAYALKLYEIGALRVKRRQTVWKGDVIAFRAALGISPNVYKDFAQLRRKVLTVCKNEIDELAHFTVEWTEIRQGRAVRELEIVFRPKETPKVIDHQTTTRELETQRNQVVRPPAAKSDGQVMFPAGSLQFGADQEIFARIARSSGGGWDIDLIADAFRDHLGERLGKLHGSKLKAAWKGFCESYHNRRGNP
ncbi:replication protein RepA [Komagataeibacter xylinus NBRC 13693]|uniref:Replication protein RepA n=1 Tax=Komagataeibacter xylinus NBRC 13693 TaxID=1234668 RepID=A0A0D6QBP5_KOMXY|nr:replication initiation protein [Komagataeibacter xylinus]GAO00391.1 replication protein RepA [Komagataeibacter xylinus NBRC 13693]